ncbi:hypothetical protein Oter_3984 [Opitutus terrae PB90-1]|uniref:Uncharacterized protein n=1 Tax=Opitutus terrae (strain DSM 11246 / JCM 15787 / PB90-1) TaxID=452637 RepID=B1ZZS2_OPITP|nr:hypothetical protein Oter_3984 [Opitutus terrae PB90-1]
MLVGHFGTDLPEADQWDAEGLHLLVPWFRHQSLLPELFTPHNEHYVVFTKLLNLALALLNGAWDQRLECMVNALLPASIAVGLLAWARRQFVAVPVSGLAWAIALFWGLPLGWENAISGFHSQQFFLIATALVTILTLPFTVAWSRAWWLGVFAAAMALLSMGSGFLAAAAVLTVVTLRLASRETALAGAWPTLLLAGGLCLVGWVIRPEVPYHAMLKAQNVGDFMTAAGHNLRWPLGPAPWFALLVWFPLGWLAVSLLPSRRRIHHRATAWSLLGLGGWTVLQIIAVAYARGAGGPVPASRYVDNLIVGVIANAFALLWLYAQSDPRSFLRRIVAVMGGAWIVLLACGLLVITREALSAQLPAVANSRTEALLRTRGFLLTGERRLFDSADLPYPDADALVTRLRQPELARLLPASVRPALALLPSPANGLDPGVLASEHRLDPEFNGRSIRSLLTEPVYRSVWRTTTVGPDSSALTWRSLPMDAGPISGRLLFSVSGRGDANNITIELLASETGTLISRVPLPDLQGDCWQIAAVHTPSSPFLLQIRQSPHAEDFVFSSPVVMSSLSFAAWRLAEYASSVLALGLVLMAFGSLLMTRDRAPSARLRAIPPIS